MVSPGERIGRYRLTRRLGAGAFATVWLGDDEDLEVSVAVKVLADNWSTHADVRERFVTEAKLMRRIADDRVIKVYDIGSLDDDRPYFVMDFANGGTLADRLAGGVNPQEALLLGAEAARAVQVLHENGVLHRDVTPANLLIRTQPDGGQHVVITDLGMAKAIAEATGLTMAAGTPAYMAPEQASGLGGFDARADVYSVAAVVYTMLSGQPPFGGSNLVAVMSRSAQLRPEPLARRLDGPRELDPVLFRALSFDPDERPRTAAEFADELDRLADGWARLPRARANGAAAAFPVTVPLPLPLTSDSAWRPVEPADHLDSATRSDAFTRFDEAELGGALDRSVADAEPDGQLRSGGLEPADTAALAEPAVARPADPPARPARLGFGFWLFAALVFVLVALATWAVQSGSFG